MVTLKLAKIIFLILNYRVIFVFSSHTFLTIDDKWGGESTTERASDDPDGSKKEFKPDGQKLSETPSEEYLKLKNLGKINEKKRIFV